MRFALSFIAAVILFSIAAHASPPPPLRPFYVDIGNGMVFHFTPDGYEERGYLPTGVYLDGELVYLINEPFYLYDRFRAYFSNDGMTFLEVPVILHPFGVFTSHRAEEWHPYGTAAVRVFYRGDVVKYHRIPDLVNNKNRLRVSDSHVWWDELSLRHHDFENNTLQVTTLERRTITFDITTGAIINIQQRIPWLLIAGITVIAAAFFTLLTKLLVAKSGIFRAYLAGTKGAVLFELFFTIALVFILAFGGTLFFGIVVAITGLVIVCMMSANTCFAKYFSVMPVKPKIIILAEYLYFLLFMAAGVALAAICAIIIGQGFAVSLNIILFVLGYMLTSIGLLIPLYPMMKATWIFLFLTPILQMYLVLGISRVHEIFAAALTATPVGEVQALASVPRWLVFIAVSLAVYVGSYIVLSFRT